MLAALQDAWCVQERLAGQDMVMFGVFDGHGQEGKTVSHSVCTNVPKSLSKHAACKVGMSLGAELCGTAFGTGVFASSAHLNSQLSCRPLS